MCELRSVVLIQRELRPRFLHNLVQNYDSGISILLPDLMLYMNEVTYKG